MQGCRPLTPDEVTSLLDCIKNPRDRLLVLTPLTFGVRVTEAVNLNIADVCEDYIYIRSLKGSRNTSFPIPDLYKAAVRDLLRYYHRRDFDVTPKTPLFKALTRNKGHRLTRQQASNVVKFYANTANLTGKVNTNSLRKAYGSAVYAMILERGGDILELRNYMRHVSIQSTIHYVESLKRDGKLIHELPWTTNKEVSNA